MRHALTHTRGTEVPRRTHIRPRTDFTYPPFQTCKHDLDRILLSNPPFCSLFPSPHSAAFFPPPPAYLNLPLQKCIQGLLGLPPPKAANWINREWPVINPHFPPLSPPSVPPSKPPRHSANVDKYSQTTRQVMRCCTKTRAWNRSSPSITSWASARFSRRIFAKSKSLSGRVSGRGSLRDDEEVEEEEGGEEEEEEGRRKFRRR